MIINTDKLVNSTMLLELLFAEDCRPTIRWLQLRMKSRDIPYIKIGHSVFFDVVAVRDALAKTKTIRSRRVRVPAHAN